MPPVAVPVNSTNVRILTSLATAEGDRAPARLTPHEDTGRVVALAVAGWGAVVSGAALDGAFARLGPAPFTILAIFALAYAAAVYALDGAVRDWLWGRGPRTLVAASIAIDLALGLGACDALRAGDAWPQLLATLRGPVLALIVAPLALPGHLAAARALAQRRLSSAAGRSPGARPAAT